MKFCKVPSLNLLLVWMVCWGVSCGERTNTGTAQSGEEQVADTLADQDMAATDTQGVLTTVDGIRQAHAAIMTKLDKGGLDSAFFTYSCHEEKKGTVSYYSDKGQLRIIVHRYSEYDHHSAEDTYFVQDSTLFFTYFKRVSWSFAGPEGATKDDITERRIYLLDQQPVQCLEKKYTVLSEADSNPTSAEVPNKGIDCTSLDADIKLYHTLLNYHHNPTSGCLGE